MTLAVLLAVFRIGIIGCDTSHTEEFAKIANVDKDPRVAGFLVTCAYKWGSADIVSSTNRYPSIIAKLREMGVEMKDSIADLLKDCDGVLLETCDGRPHYAQALEVFKSGKPCFIDKPVAADLKDVVRIVEAGRKYNAKWFCTSALRFLPGIAEVRSGKAGKIRGVETWTPIETDPTQSRYYWYAIHGAEPLFAAMGTGCESVSVVSTGSDEILTGVWSDGRIGVVHATPWGKGAGHGGMYFPEDDYHPQPVSFGKYLGYPPLLASIVEFFQTGKTPVTPEETLEIYAFLSAAEKSRAQGGVPVRLKSMLDSAPGLAVTLTPGNFEVVVDRSATPTARYAGREATNFLSQVLGAAVPIVAEPTAGKAHLFVGDGAAARAAGFDVSKLKRDAFRTRANGRDIYLLGRDDPKEDPQAFADGNLRFFAERATLFAVYDFLERYAGCRFFFPGELGTVVPRKNRIDVPDCDRLTAPDSDERRYTRDPVECGTWYDPSVDRKALHGVAWMRWRLATRTLPCCHGQRYFKYVSRFSKEHPDWFCLKADGTRNFSEHEHMLSANNKFCYTSGIREEIYQDAKAYLSGAKAATRGLERWGDNCKDEVVDVMPEDGFAECHCANCQAAYTKFAGKDRLGNYANDLIWGLTAEIGRRLKAEGVPGYITQMAYHPYGDVPSFDLPNNIQVMVATRGPWDIAKPEAFAKEVARVRAWCEKTGNRVWLWTYPGNYYGDYSNVPVVCPRAYAKFYKAVAPYARFGFTENMCDRFAYDLVNLYVFSRLAWDPSLDIDALLDDYCGNLFGPAAAPMKQVIDLFEEKWIGGVCAGGSIITPVGPKPIKIADAQLYSEIYADAFFRRMESLFAEAGRLTADGSRERRAVGMFYRELLKPLRAAKSQLDPAVELRRRAETKPTNLLSNADFADGMKGWNTQTPKAPPAFDADDKVAGAACCELDGIGGEPPHYYTLASIYQGRIPVRKGRTYRLSYFLKCKDVVPTALAQWHGAGAGGVVWLPNKRYFKFPTPMSVGTHGWIHRSHEIKVQEDGEASVEFRLVQATGKMRVCGVLFEELPNEETTK